MPIRFFAILMELVIVEKVLPLGSSGETQLPVVKKLTRATMRNFKDRFFFYIDLYIDTATFIGFSTLLCNVYKYKERLQHQ